MAKVAAIQMASGPNVSANLSEAKRLITDAVKQGAELVVLPENFAHMGMSEPDVLEVAEDYISESDSAEHPRAQIQNFIAALAKEEKVWILAGTIPLRSSPESDKILSASLLFNDAGTVVARYDKIHLFDVDLGDQGGAYNESAFTDAGNKVVVVDTPFGKLGIAICYDLRFPELFRDMVSQGMEVLGLVSSFTATTGKAHWEVLNRSRAIENLCFVVSAAQGGYHVNGRETHGDSMIVDPWGGVMDRLPHGSGFAIADIKTENLQQTRKNFPVLEHIKLPCHLK
ncbi:MAG: carbon-nitrogen hydrolase family protein [gamma proteobacterium symbiont of Bathyaustriella thionipta]|nr:carbon-nitrogen hydrolase family protein [gamma proteobacterium symbiont of Bathyaustriella thionipta]MCU7948648.1 carbon-nitrogen hydrolase family protein [gamma proteobacterium symbiont of Bathyaustriella thionipta]MCU7953714.1 carbon-nitrogen hydrolase family protein [gamma proteobacterium symbiont of Bathyaustriella thionipta]MCU7955179.1 carbon-nitrogen hydrolase family protein [gamma proteobacterium symbiont of Bathyaustriella thionipta]MCU7968705.1 carbon-nitrogen hydrolase family pro